MNGIRVFLFLGVFALFFSSGGYGKCPPPEELKKKLVKIWPRSKDRLKVEKVSLLSEWPEFCEALVSFGGPFKNFVYIHKSGRFAFTGQLLDLSKGENLTRKKLAALQRLNLLDILRLEGAVGYVWGPKKGKFLYLITDPDCNYCKKILPVLEKLVREGKVTVKVIYYPLEKLHPKAKAKAVSIICEKKPPTELLKNYQPVANCEVGQKKVEYAQRVLRSLGIRSVPVLIRSDGKMLKGAVPETRLREFIDGGTKK